MERKEAYFVIFLNASFFVFTILYIPVFDE